MDRLLRSYKLPNLHFLECNQHQPKQLEVITLCHSEQASTISDKSSFTALRFVEQLLLVSKYEYNSQQQTVVVGFWIPVPCTGMVGRGLVKNKIMLALQFLPTLDLPSTLSSKAQRQAEPKITPILSVPVCRDTVFPRGNRLLLCKYWASAEHSELSKLWPTYLACSKESHWHVGLTLAGIMLGGMGKRSRRMNLLTVSTQYPFPSSFSSR